ncbi:50S ribosomal protein L15 [Lacticaseibacillus brantae]|uniref:Large ribosomal subunit protein uL15 n=1 Tax=Lacticaseibacillus brantae DSM 23927 TaxID=1423727 RepID=A0A0R2AVE7_9LACO|nr:50S ribosomal protein L15 [Lacticaseibacillus brantae]KRM71409.1 50S ribosomal protein L15 [Lacticaseibacillus brantae DSM 23927]
MKLHELKPSEGSRHSRKRLGRGTSSGQGKTAGRGQKGQLARQGGKTRLGFEGGQMPLFRRMPKRGFNNINRKVFAVVNIADLNRFEDGTEVTPALLVEAGLVKNERDGIKLLANGSLEKKLSIKVNHASNAAKEAVVAAGGSIEVI